MTARDDGRRARRLVAFYPERWRDRFGDEFEQLLIDDMRERPRSVRRGLDVAAHGAWARLVDAGVVGRGFAPTLQAWIALRALALIAAVFAVLATGMWAQLTVSWQWSAPPASSTRTAMWLMSGALSGLGVVLLVAFVVVGYSVTAAAVRRQARIAWMSWSLSVGCALLFCVGCHHFGALWPGTGGHPWAERGLVPDAVARPTWAATLWISAYWAHPGALRQFPIREVAWMAVSPLLLAMSFIGALRAARQMVLSKPALRSLAILGTLGVTLAALFVAGATDWVFSRSSGPHGLFAVGVIDELGLLVLAITLIAGAHTARRAIAVTIRPG
jgi:hypothetical protein